MSSPFLRTARALWRRLWTTPDRELVDAGGAGELLVARARLAFGLLILVVPLLALLRAPAQPENWIGLAAAALTALLAALVLAAVRRGWRRDWLGFATSLYDVTTVSLVLTAFVVMGAPRLASNSRVTYDVYFLAIGATCLRYDRRVCILAGLVAAGQYSAIVWVAAHLRDADPALAAQYGAFSAVDQIGRVLLLLVATGLAATLVDRTERLRVLSTHDALTDLYNRAYFEERLAEELLRARRYGRTLVLALVDVDRFKQVNDRFGHGVGDMVLRSFGEVLRESMRRTDIVTRFGGEEFAIILPETALTDALAKFDRVRERVESLRIPVPEAGQAVQLTFSAGLAEYPADGAVPESLVAAADVRLLEAKARGRNRVLGGARSAVEDPLAVPAPAL